MNSLIHKPPSKVLEPSQSPTPSTNSSALLPTFIQDGISSAPSCQTSSTPFRSCDGNVCAIPAETRAACGTLSQDDDRALRQEEENDTSMVTDPTPCSSQQPPPDAGPPSTLPLYSASLPPHHHTLYQMMMAASVLRLPGVMARALMGGSLSTPTPQSAPADPLAPFYIQPCSDRKQRGLTVAQEGGAQCLMKGWIAHQGNDVSRARSNADHGMAGDTKSDNDNENIGNPISSSETPHGSAEPFSKTLTTEAASPGMDYTASRKMKPYSSGLVKSLYPVQGKHNTGTPAEKEESRESQLVKHQVFRPTPTRATASQQQEQHVMVNIVQQQQQLMLSIPAPVRGGVHRPHPYSRGALAPSAANPIFLQHGVSFRDTFRDCATNQDRMLLAAAADRARSALRQPPSGLSGLLCSPEDREGDEEGDQVTGEKRRKSESRPSGALLDIAACDGPVFFERVLNKAFAGNCLEDIDSDMEINVDELDSADDATVVTSTGSSQQHGGVNTAAKGSSINTPEERMEKVTMAGKQAVGSSTRLLHHISSTYHCVYCNHTFKSHYCYQKHMRRHINPITVEVGPRAVTSSLGTSKKNTEGVKKTELSSQDKVLRDSSTDHPESGLRLDSSSNGSEVASCSKAIDQQAMDGVDEKQQMSSKDSDHGRDVLPTTSCTSGPLLLASIRSDSMQQAAPLLAPAALKGASPLSPRLPSPLPVKASLDLNVQYFPCKTCGSKFPSYYFVHKHRRLCHGEEGAGGGGDQSSGNSNHSGGGNNSNQYEGSDHCSNNSDAADTNSTKGYMQRSGDSNNSNTAHDNSHKAENTRNVESWPVYAGDSEVRAIRRPELRTVSPPLDALTSETGAGVTRVTSAPCSHNGGSANNYQKESKCNQLSAKWYETGSGIEEAPETMVADERLHSHEGARSNTDTNNDPINCSPLEAGGHCSAKTQIHAEYKASNTCETGQHLIASLQH